MFPKYCPKLQDPIRHEIWRKKVLVNMCLQMFHFLYTKNWRFSSSLVSNICTLSATVNITILFLWFSEITPQIVEFIGFFRMCLFGRGSYSKGFTTCEFTIKKQIRKFYSIHSNSGSTSSKSINFLTCFEWIPTG